MRCARCKELIMADYTDGELDQKLQKEVAAHLVTCAGCRELKDALLKKAVTPIKRAEKVKAPDFIWQGIRERIISQNAPAEQGALASLRDRLSRVFTIPKPVLAAAAVMVLIFGLTIAGLSIYRKPVNGYLLGESEFFSTEVGENNGKGGLVDTDFGTSIEMFLM